MKAKKVLLFTCLVLVQYDETVNAQDGVQNSQTTPSPSPFHVGPQYTIACLSNGAISVKGMHPDTKQINIKSKQNKCTSPVTAENSFFTIPANCMDTEDYKKERSVTFEIIDKSIDGIRSSTPTPTVKSLGGGQYSHTITVKCQPLRSKGMQTYIVHGVGVVQGAIIKVPTELDNVEMRLKAEEFDLKEDITELPDVSSVYIGDKFYMYLVYTGKDEYKVIPESCKAYDGAYAAEPSSSVKEVDLWDRSTCVKPDAANYHLMHNFKVSTGTKTVVYAEMFGFRFSNNKDITFVCTVRICPTTENTGNCHLNQGKNCSDISKWSASRRRRSNKNGQYKVVRRIKVTDRKTDNAAGMISCSWLFVVVMQMFVKLM